MTVVHPWAVVLAAVPLLWVIITWRRSGNRFRLLLKGLALSAISLAYAEPTVTMPQVKTGAVILCDVSASIPESEIQRASSLTAEMERSQKGNWMTVIPFASDVHAFDRNIAGEEASLLQIHREAGSDHTNLEAALMDGVTLVPTGYIPRVVLMSDGNENEGSVARALAEMQALHVPVDAIPLSTTADLKFYPTGFSAPEQAFANEQIPIDLTVVAAEDADARVEIAAEGKSLGDSPIHLQQGVNRIRVHARVKHSGATLLSARVYGLGGEDVVLDGALELRRAQVLYVSGDPPSADSNLLAAFHNAEFDVVRAASIEAQKLSRFQLVVLNNIDLNSIPATWKKQLSDFVENGGGLLVIGGDKQIYREPTPSDPLQRILPAKLTPPKKPEGMCVALIVDKSSSMEGRKIDLARLSAIGVVEHLKPTDTIGVLMFDNSFQWAVPMRRADDKTYINRLIAGITPDGGTQIAPALEEAYQHVLASNAAYKHIVLLTDGISEEGDSVDLAREAAQHDITISTVGLGTDVNRSYLERVAAASGGKSYFLNEPQGLQQILLKDVMDYGGSTAVEKLLTPVVQSEAEMLDGVDMQHAPPLKGYVRFEAKPTAQTILSVDQSRKDPLYVRWQYGLGRVGVFTSDAKSRWAEAWMNWPGFDKFWVNVSHDLLSHTEDEEARVDYDSANGDLLVTYRLGPSIDTSQGPPPLFVVGPSGFEAPVDVRLVAPRVYRGTVHIGERTGLFRIRPVDESKAFPEVSYYRPNEEVRARQANEALLREVASFTGGRFRPDVASVFDPGDKTLVKTWQFWPGLLGLAILLNLAELILRKWSGLAGWLRARM